MTIQIGKDLIYLDEIVLIEDLQPFSIPIGWNKNGSIKYKDLGIGFCILFKSGTKKCYTEQEDKQIKEKHQKIKKYLKQKGELK